MSWFLLFCFEKKKFYCDKYILNTGETFINPVSFSYPGVVILYNPEDNCKESQQEIESMNCTWVWRKGKEEDKTLLTLSVASGWTFSRRS